MSEARTCPVRTWRGLRFPAKTFHLLATFTEWTMERGPDSFGNGQESSRNWRRPESILPSSLLRT